MVILQDSYFILYNECMAAKSGGERAARLSTPFVFFLTTVQINILYYFEAILLIKNLAVVLEEEFLIGRPGCMPAHLHTCKSCILKMNSYLMPASFN